MSRIGVSEVASWWGRQPNSAPSCTRPASPPGSRKPRPHAISASPSGRRPVERLLRASSRNATGADVSALNPTNVTAMVAAYKELAAGADVSTLKPSEITAYITKYLEKEGVKVVVPTENQNKVMDFIFNGVKSGNINMSLSGIEAAVKELKEKGASIILLGCTELSAVSDRIKELDYVFVDPLEILAHNAVIEGGKKAKEV